MNDADSESDFPALLARVRSGDQQAAAELVARYEPQIRRVIRVRLTDPALRRQMDSVDICQSVMGQFFVRASMGQFDLDEPKQLVGLLATMARNALIKKLEAQRAAKRDVRRVSNVDGAADVLAGPDRGASSIIANRELLGEVRSRMTEEERQVADQRAAGAGWVEIAAALHTKPDALRIRFTRTLNRIAAELGLDDG